MLLLGVTTRTVVSAAHLPQLTWGQSCSTISTTVASSSLCIPLSQLPKAVPRTTTTLGGAPPCQWRAHARAAPTRLVPGAPAAGLVVGA